MLSDMVGSGVLHSHIMMEASAARHRPQNSPAGWRLHLAHHTRDAGLPRTQTASRWLLIEAEWHVRSLRAAAVVRCSVLHSQRGAVRDSIGDAETSLKRSPRVRPRATTARGSHDGALAGRDATVGVTRRARINTPRRAPCPRLFLRGEQLYGKDACDGQCSAQA
jgi:hypothetical protein